MAARLLASLPAFLQSAECHTLNCKLIRPWPPLAPDNRAPARSSHLMDITFRLMEK